MIDAYPLSWPAGWPRTSFRMSSRFNTTFAVARDQLIKEIGMMGGREIIISTNIELRGDGLPYANRRQPDDTGVAVYFKRKGMQQCFPCDRWTKIEDNMHAIRLTVQALRGIERWGSGKMMEAAFTGFKALPAANTTPWWSVLKCQPTYSNDAVKDMYRQLTLQHHPDRGGTVARMAEINEAYAEFRRERGIN